MKVIKSINTNAAMALDSSGKEIVIFGKGVGFPKTPYELDDLSKVERSFYGIDPKHLTLIAELPQNTILAGADIVEKAEAELGCELNPNLPFTIADHLNFAITRVKNGIIVPTPLAYDVKHLYPKETSIGVDALKIMEQYTGVKLPEDEVYAVAMHIINAEVNTGSITSMMQTQKIVNDLKKLIEEYYNIKLNIESYSYSRFMMHLQYLIERLRSSRQVEEKVSKQTIMEMGRTYPMAYDCAKKISDYLNLTYTWKCNNEEMMYLLLHIQRVSISN